MHDPNKQPALVLAKRNLKGRNLNVSVLWYASIRNIEGRKLKLPMARPFMNFKEGREQLAALLGTEPARIRFMAFQGQRTFYFSESPADYLRQVEALTDPS
jgi:hypothetical protein